MPFLDKTLRDQALSKFKFNQKRLNRSHSIQPFSASSNGLHPAWAASSSSTESDRLAVPIAHFHIGRLDPRPLYSQPFADPRDSLTWDPNKPMDPMVRTKGLPALPNSQALAYARTPYQLQRMVDSAPTSSRAPSYWYSASAQARMFAEDGKNFGTFRLGPAASALRKPKYSNGGFSRPRAAQSSGKKVKWDNSVMETSFVHRAHGTACTMGHMGVVDHEMPTCVTMNEFDGRRPDTRWPEHEKMDHNDLRQQHLHYKVPEYRQGSHFVFGDHNKHISTSEEELTEKQAHISFKDKYVMAPLPEPEGPAPRAGLGIKRLRGSDYEPLVNKLGRSNKHIHKKRRVVVDSAMDLAEPVDAAADKAFVPAVQRKPPPEERLALAEKRRVVVADSKPMVETVSEDWRVDTTAEWDELVVMVPVPVKPVVETISEDWCVDTTAKWDESVVMVPVPVKPLVETISEEWRVDTTAEWDELVVMVPVAVAEEEQFRDAAQFVQEPQPEFDESMPIMPPDDDGDEQPVPVGGDNDDVVEEEQVQDAAQFVQEPQPEFDEPMPIMPPDDDEDEEPVLVGDDDDDDDDKDESVCVPDADPSLTSPIVVVPAEPASTEMLGSIYIQVGNAVVRRSARLLAKRAAAFH